MRGRTGAPAGVDVAGVSVRIGSRAVLNDVSLEIPPGKVTALVGPNGAGKSTMLSVISGDRRPGSGTVRIAGEPADRLSRLAAARLRAVMLQSQVTTFAYRTRELLEMSRNPWRGRPEADRDEAAIGCAVERTGIAHLLDRDVTTLSGGEAQRVALARALAQETPVLLLDEPTSAMDVRHQEECLRLCRDMSRERDVAVGVVLHDLQLVAAHCDRVVLLHEGRVRCQGDVDDVLVDDVLSEVYGIPLEVFWAAGQRVVRPLRPTGHQVDGGRVLAGA